MSFMIDRITTAISPHQHNMYEIIICTGGSGAFYGTEEVAISKGSIIIVPPGVMHHSVAQDTLDRIYIEGKIRTTTYEDQTGIRRYRTEILAENMEMLSYRAAANTQSAGETK